MSCGGNSSSGSRWTLLLFLLKLLTIKISSRPVIFCPFSKGGGSNSLVVFSMHGKGEKVVGNETNESWINEVIGVHKFTVALKFFFRTFDLLPSVLWKRDRWPSSATIKNCKQNEGISTSRKRVFSTHRSHTVYGPLFGAGNFHFNTQQWKFFVSITEIRNSTDSVAFIFTRKAVWRREKNQSLSGGTETYQRRLNYYCPYTYNTQSRSIV